MLRYLSGVLMLASASSLVEKLPMRVVFVQFLLSYNIFYYLSFSRSVLGNKVSSESDIERSSLNQRRTGTAHHAILQIRGVKRLIDPCSLPSLAGSLPQVQDLVRLRTCTDFVAENNTSGSASQHCSLVFLSQGTLALHAGSRFTCEATSEMSPDIMLEDIEMTEGPFHGDLPWCHMALYLSHGYKCDKCPDGQYMQTGLRDANQTLYHEPVPSKCQPCMERKQCDKGYMWKDCNATSGVCTPCSAMLPSNALYIRECLWDCHEGYFKHEERCHACTHLDLSEPLGKGVTYHLISQPCKIGMYKICTIGGIARCTACTNALPLNAEFSGSASNEYINFCPWRCLAGFYLKWYNEKTALCEACSNYKPENSHFVLHTNQIEGFADGKCPWQCDKGFEPALFDCQSDLQWVDKHGYGCSQYKPGWCEISTLHALEENYSASEACCHCGGGSRSFICVPCRNEPKNAVWTGLDEHSHIYNSTRWTLIPNCSWDCEVHVQGPLYKAGINCDRCDVEPCDIGYFRDMCRAGHGARCLPCTNALPSAAFYTTQGDPINNNFCDWDCEGIYDRIDDSCVVGSAATLTLIISGAVLALCCFCVIGHNLWKSPANRNPEDVRFALQSLEQRREQANRFLRLTQVNADIELTERSQIPQIYFDA